jgi:hypothetical protein
VEIGTEVFCAFLDVEESVSEFDVIRVKPAPVVFHAEQEFSRFSQFHGDVQLFTAAVFGGVVDGFFENKVQVSTGIYR